jgi:type II restriction enzyme
MCNISPERCGKSFEDLVEDVERLKVDQNYKYLDILRNFEQITENNLRPNFSEKINKSNRSIDQLWKSCKGKLYEYVTCKAISEIIEYLGIKERVKVITRHELGEDQLQKITIQNWELVTPDIDMLIIDNEDNKNPIRAIISCKTSLRERLTETAFWKRELEKKGNKINIIFITTDKDDEIRKDPNRYIVMHVLDYTIITSPEQLNKIINHWNERYGDRADYNKLINKIGGVEKLCQIICMYIYNDSSQCNIKCNQLTQQ